MRKTTLYNQIKPAVGYPEDILYFLSDQKDQSKRNQNYTHSISAVSVQKDVLNQGHSDSLYLIMPLGFISIFSDFLPDLTTSDYLFHLLYCIYGRIFECKSQ